MNTQVTNNTTHPARNISNLSSTAGWTVFLLHLYFYCYPWFEARKMYTVIGNRLLVRIAKTGIFDNPNYSKGLALVFLLLGVLATPLRRETGRSRMWKVAGLVLAGGVYFLVRPGLFGGALGYEIYAGVCGIMLFIMLILTGSLARHSSMPGLAKDDPFGVQKAGFPQESRRYTADFGFSFKGWYRYEGRRRRSWINIVNPRRGILVLGTPGSGKSRFIIEPLIAQLMQKGMAIFIYDYKYDALTRIAYSHFEANRRRYPEGAAFYSINFTDLSRSHRCNVLDPATLKWPADAIGASNTILLSLNKTWVHRQGDFFIESPIIFVAALIWWLKKYQGGRYCTLPQVIELSKQSYDVLFPLLAKTPEVADMIQSFLQAYINQSTEMLDGQMAGARIPLARLSSPDIYYVLSGNDVTLDINNPAAPKVLCLGGDPMRAEALAPVLSLYIDRLTRICNRPGQYPCAIVCDEFATVRASGMLGVMATGRSNNIIPVLALQDMAQLRTHYSKDEADGIMNISGNVFCGQAGGETARWISEKFPKVMKERLSVSEGGGEPSTSRHLQWEPVMTPATLAGLSSGEFVGVVADDPEVELGVKAFHARVMLRKGRGVAKELPVVRPVSEEEVQREYERVRGEVQRMVMGR